MAEETTQTRDSQPMTKAEIEARKQALIKQQADIKAEMAKLRKEGSARARADRDKKRFLVGACVFQKIELGQLSEEELQGWMEPFLKRPHERDLFGLKPLLVAEEQV